ncbi:MAG: hypothetical protein R6W77_02385, partial [Trueperaceae bacterium]
AFDASAVVLLQFLVLLLPRDVAFMPIIYASPWLTTAALVAFGFRVSRRALAMLAAIVTISVLVALLGPGSPLNVAVSVMTYGSALLLVLATGRPYQDRLVRAWSRGLLLVAGFLLAYGLAQMVRHGFPLALPYRDFSPDVFAGPYGRGGPRLVTMLFVPALFWVSVATLRRPRLRVRDVAAVVALVFAVVAPGSNATILAFAAAVAAFLAGRAVLTYVRAVAQRASPTVRTRVRATVAWLGLLAVVGLASTWLLLGSGSYVQRSLSRFTSQPQSGQVSPKAVVAWDTLTKLPVDAPYQPAVGLGLGNYSSWSQLLLSGVYVERFLYGRVSALPVSVNEVSWRHVLVHISPEAYERYGRFYIESVATQPWFAWQSLYAEIGVVGLLLLAVALAPRLHRLTIGSHDPERLRILKLTLGLYLWFAVFMGFVDNYFEYPWLLAPLLLGLVLVPRRNAVIAVIAADAADAAEDGDRVARSD